MAHRNPLHPPVHKSQISTYSTLTGALGRTRVPYSLAQSPPGSPGRSVGNTLLKGTPGLELTFDSVGRVSGLGLPVVELASRTEQALAPMMINPHEPIYMKGLDRVKLLVSWPGYHTSGHYTPMFVDGKSITRLQLAIAAAKAIESFVANARFAPVNPSCPLWSLNTNSGFDIGLLWLVGLDDPVGDSTRVNIHLALDPST